MPEFSPVSIWFFVPTSKYIIITYQKYIELGL